MILPYIIQSFTRRGPLETFSSAVQMKVLEDAETGIYSRKVVIDCLITSLSPLWGRTTYICFYSYRQCLQESTVPLPMRSRCRGTPKAEWVAALRIRSNRIDPRF